LKEAMEGKHFEDDEAIHRIVQA